MPLPRHPYSPICPDLAADWRYRMQFFVNIQNVTNHANYIGYSGVYSSLFFRQPTAVANPRKVDIGMNFQF